MCEINVGVNISRYTVVLGVNISRYTVVLGVNISRYTVVLGVNISRYTVVCETSENVCGSICALPIQESNSCRDSECVLISFFCERQQNTCMESVVLRRTGGVSDEGGVVVYIL